MLMLKHIAWSKQRDKRCSESGAAKGQAPRASSAGGSMDMVILETQVS